MDMQRGIDLRVRSAANVAAVAQAKAMRGLLSGDATFEALTQAVEELSKSAPQDHDVLIHAFNISVVKVRYIQPHTFIFEGFNDEGHTTFATCHFSQLVAHVVYVPKRGRERILTGFAKTEH
jgi:hypothetical protein